MTRKSIKIENINISYREKGSGEVLLLIHGIGGSLVFDEVIKPLSAKFRVIVIDLPGFGNSDKPRIDYTIEFYSEFIRNFCVALNLERINLVGLSIGGMIAADFASKQPEKVVNLFLAGSAGLKSVTNCLNNEIAFKVFSFFMKYFVFSNRIALRRFQTGSFYNPKRIPKSVFDAFYNFLKMPGAKEAWFSTLKNVLKIDRSFFEKLKKINTNTVIIWGSDDRTFPVELADEFARHIEKSSVVVIPECGHTLTVEKPTEFCSIVIGFIEGKNRK